ncbi:unnamed protein product [Somion occarium]|uniref:Uncharacterized protein n=1 Tax=Somion occarium TaxID=3059160 RepID=A0ABP1D6N0_9APHY
MRSGGATFLAEQGTPPSLIQAAGRWTSDAWQAYIRKHPLLLNVFLFANRLLARPPIATTTPNTATAQLAVVVPSTYKNEDLQSMLLLLFKGYRSLASIPLELAHSRLKGTKSSAMTRLIH